MTAIFGNDFAVGQLFDSYEKYKSRSDFTIIRLQNGTRIDSKFFTHWANTKGEEFRIPYMNLIPVIWGGSIEKQILSFHQNVMKYAPEYSMVMLDVENNLLTSTMVAKAFDYAKYLFGNYPMPYSSQYYWKKDYPNLPVDVPKFVANYPNSLKYFRYTDPKEMAAKVEATMKYGFPSMPNGWSLKDSKGRPNGIWQFTMTGIGTDWGLKYPDSKSIDVDYFPGTKEDFRNMVLRWKGLDEIKPPQPPVQVGGVIKEVIVTATALNVREEPSGTSKDVGTLLKDTEVPVYAEKGDWYRIGGWIHKGYTKDK